jgi:hypothetical protein
MEIQEPFVDVDLVFEGQFGEFDRFEAELGLCVEFFVAKYEFEVGESGF